MTETSSQGGELSHGFVQFGERFIGVAELRPALRTPITSASFNSVSTTLEVVRPKCSL